MSDQPAHMWSYWRDKKGLVEAATEYYPVSAKREDIQAAIAQIKSGELYLDMLMNNLEDEIEE